jgi:hypothetical protein
MVDDIGSLLEARGHVGDSWPWFRGFMPATSSDLEQAVAITEFPAGTPPMSSGPEPRGLQVRVRGEIGDYDTPQRKIREIYNELHAMGPTLVGSTDVRWISAQQASELPLGPDKAGRFEFTWNFTVAASR